MFIKQDKSNIKYLLIVLVLATIVGVGILGYLKYFYKLPAAYTLSPAALQTFVTKKECEEETDCECAFVTCDYIPPGKTFEEVCGKDFKKGWQCIKAFSQQIIDKCEEEAGFVEQVRSDPDCLGGEEFRCVDGWGEKWHYDKRLVSTTEFPSTFPSRAPEELKEATVAKRSSSVCACKDPISYEILVEDKFEKTTCENFYKFIEDYNSSCNNCLLIWSFECC